MTPTASTASPGDHKDLTEDPFTATAAGPDEEQESVRRTLPQPSEREATVEDTFGKPSVDQMHDIPGAFPHSRAETPGIDPAVIAAGAGVATVAAGVGIAAAATNGDKKPSTPPKSTEQNFDDFFGGPAHQRSASQKAADFDSAFADIDKPKAGGEHPEFPDIQEVGGEDEDDSSEYSDDEAPMKFDDNFNARSPPRDTPTDVRSGKQPEIPPASNSMLSPPRPPLGGPSSTATSLPGPESQQPPPTYGDAFPDEPPTHFPREYEGLLPEREDPTSPPPTAGGSTHPASPPGGDPPAYGPEAHARSPSESKASAPPPTKAAPFDFDSAFSGVGAAPVEDDDDDDDDEGAPFGAPKTAAPEFDPTFDSPPRPTREQFPSTGPVTNGAPKSRDNDFYSAVTAPSASQPAQSTASPVSHDWDALFAPLNTDSPAPSHPQPTPDFPQIQSNNAVPSQPQPETASDYSQIQTEAAEVSAPSPPRGHSGVSSATPTPTPAQAPSSPPPVQSSPPPSLAPPPQSKAARPTAGRALSAGTEHDDPILKRLTAMGWSRDESLNALERFDYNIDKVSD